MLKTAVMWIRDGVLVDRMHINPVAFAYAMWVFFVPEQRAKTSLESLISFGFEKSGFSCAEKMRLYNSECESSALDVDSAADFYNILVADAARNAQYFKGTAELLRDLQSGGIQNFITSAVEQEILDEWFLGRQGREIADYMYEVLGRREKFSKGRDHFEYVSKLGNKKIYYVADAVSEIATGSRYSRQYKIVPVGFGHVITVERVMEAVELIKQVWNNCGPTSLPSSDIVRSTQLDPSKIIVPGKKAVQSSLTEAGAQQVVDGPGTTLMQNLRHYFEGQFG
jgi:phosphoglycolate phosphatase-like HAD superfamily hydrolase